MTKLQRAGLLSAILVGAVGLKAILLAFNSVPFNADEAIVALMARHILQGKHTWFFYGQAYMGSLDAYIVAAAFALMGESVLAIRIAQTILFALILLTSYVVTRRLTGSPHAALISVLLFGFPPVLLTLYTTVSLGGYGEALLAGNLLLWIGHRLGHEDRDPLWIWLAWGVLAGLGFWAFGLVLVYVIPMGLWLLWRTLGEPKKIGSRFPLYLFRFGLTIIGFALGSLPWWLGNLGQLDTGIAELLGRAVRSTAGADALLGNVAARAFNFFVLGLPALFGLRFPWSVDGPPLWLGVPALALYLGALGYGIRRCQDLRGACWLLWGLGATLFLGFVLTPFGGDPSGRYFLPLYLPLFIFTAVALTRLRERIGRWAWLLLAAVIVFNLVGTAQAALHNPPGITTQFDPISQVDHGRYDELISFLRSHDETRGYTNYWIAYPLAFLSDEEIILAPRLPYKADLQYTSRDSRYVPYEEIVEKSSKAVYVTSNHPALDQLLREQFMNLGVAFQERQIGSYNIFYDLSRKVKPGELSIQPGE